MIIGRVETSKTVDCPLKNEYTDYTVFEQLRISVHIIQFIRFTSLYKKKKDDFKKILSYETKLV